MFPSRAANGVSIQMAQLDRMTSTPTATSNQPTTTPASDRLDFVNRANADYIDRLYEQYQRDPRSLDDFWQAYFAGFDSAAAGAAASGRAATPGGNGRHNPAAAAASPGRAGDVAPAPLQTGVHKLVHSYRELGHFVAKLDPLGHDRPSHPLLELSQFDMKPADLDRVVGNGGFRGPTDGTLRDLIEKLRATYCRTLGVEFT